MLAESAGRARGRAESADPGIPVAATVVLLRDGDSGPEVLVIERPDRGTFAGAWVFPGGKLEPADRLVDAEPEEHAARRAGVRETREETGLAIDPADLLTLSCWHPPPAIPVRIRTWFFAARAGEGEIVLSPDEAIAADWVRPEDLLERHGRGAATLYPPTWVTLHSLTGARDVDGLLAAARVAGFRRFESVARRGESGPLLLWQEDAEYDGSAGPAGAASARHRLELGVLPWRYIRTM